MAWTHCVRLYHEQAGYGRGAAAAGDVTTDHDGEAFIIDTVVIDWRLQEM
jgi:hypothetical protein